MTAPGFLFVGNLPWLDLVNTEPVRDGQRVDLLEGPDDLIRWLEQAGLLLPDGPRPAVTRRGHSAAGHSAFREALALRAALRAGAERLSAGRTAGDGMVRAINRVLASRPARARLVRTGNGYRTRLEPVSSSPLHLLVPVAESAAWLLEHGVPTLVRRCEGNQCVLFFYDTTRNRSRRWCSMEGCGSRAKAGAYYRRSRGQAGS
jgi:predicted RNA-binding Zn ribbon-like protein